MDHRLPAAPSTNEIPSERSAIVPWAVAGIVAITLLSAAVLGAVKEAGVGERVPAGVVHPTGRASTSACHSAQQGTGALGSPGLAASMGTTEAEKRLMEAAKRLDVIRARAAAPPKRQVTRLSTP